MTYGLLALEHVVVHGQVAELVGARGRSASLEQLVAEYLEEVLDVVARRRRHVVLNERMVEAEALDLTAGEEARLTNVEVEVLERTVAEAEYRMLLAHRALGVVARRLGGDEAMQHRQPHNGLRLELEPLEEVADRDVIGGLGVLEAAEHRGLDIGAAEGGHLAQLLGYEYDLVEESAELARRAQAARLVRHQLEHAHVLVLDGVVAERDERQLAREHLEQTAAAAIRIVDVEQPVERQVDGEHDVDAKQRVRRRRQRRRH